MKYKMYIDPTEYYTLRREVKIPTRKQIAFLAVLFIGLFLLASHYDYLILN